MKYNKNFNKGFTLIETIIVMAGSAVLLLAVIAVAITSIQGSNKSDAQALIDQEGAWIIGQIKEQILSADPEFVICAGNFRSLQIASLRDGGQTTYTCNGTAPYIASASATLSGNTTYNLVGTNMEVTDCSQFVTCTNTDYPLVNIKFTLQTGINGGFFDTRVSKNFNEQFVVRN